VNYLLELIAEAGRPVEERERREAAQLQARAGREKAEAAKRTAAEIVKREQENRGRQNLHEPALKVAGQKVDAELYRVLKQSGVTGLSSPELVTRLGRTMEGSLVMHGVGLTDVGLTRNTLSEQLRRYTDSVGRNPASFISRVERDGLHRPSTHEPSRTPSHTRSRNGRGGSGRSR
jgi:hypothetical protein